MHRITGFIRRTGFLCGLAMIAGAIAITAAGPRTEQPQAGAGAVRVNADGNGLALRGYDAVAYVTEGQPVKGVPQFASQYAGATYYFASAENRDRFAKDPAAYAPQFGGFCAYAVSRNYTADGDPLAWRIVGGKLYLNYNRRAQQKWEEDVPGNITKGDANWPALSRR